MVRLEWVETVAKPSPKVVEPKKKETVKKVAKVSKKVSKEETK
jgi:hypothetical protein